MLTHEENVEEITFKGDTFDKPFQCKKYLRAHEAVHRGANPVIFDCNYCKKTFAMLRNLPLKVHIILHHLSDYMEITGKTLCHAMTKYSI